MCGLTGFIDLKNQLNPDQLASTVEAMALAIAHRGPDDSGVWVDGPSGVAFGHRRLSILDLSEHGHQPMVSRDGRYVLVYNGEIYNHLDIRKDLTGPFLGHSDTETLVEAIAAWGVEETLRRSNGMFAFAVWDKQEKSLTLVRDRLGVKPLYWGLNGHALFFGSELKTLQELPLWACETDPQALQQYLRYAYVPAPYSLYRNVYKLLPGHILTYSPGQEPKISQFWAPHPQAELSISPEEAVDRLDALLQDSIKLRMLSDVPLGAFLSGGVDSSTVVAFMQAQSNRPIKTFTIGFEDEGYNEAHHAKAVAKHLGTDHTELYLSGQQAMDTIPLMGSIYDEPFADSSQIPTYLVSKMAREHVTVALSGDGGDEVFLGYNRHMGAQSYLKKVMGLPQWLRNSSALGLDLLSQHTWDQISHLIPASKRPRQFGDKLYKLAKVLRAGDESHIYLSLVSCFQDPNSILADAGEEAPYHIPGGVDFTQRMQLADILGYLPDDILTKVDRATMAVSLEGREPLLDYRLVEFAGQLPHDYKIRGGTSKWLLRQVLYRYVPKELIERPKTGFSIPIDQWLRGPLRDWAIETLTSLGQDATFNRPAIQQLWHEHLSGRFNHQHQLWALLMYQMWKKN